MIDNILVLLVIIFSPIIVCYYALDLAARSGYIYFCTIWQVVFAAPVRQPPPDPPLEGEEPAFRWYFKDQAMQDFLRICSNAWSTSQDTVRDRFLWMKQRVSNPQGSAFAIPVGFVGWVGVVLGAVLAVLVMLAAAAVHAAVVVLLEALAWVVIGVLRLADTVLLRLRVKGVGISCPSCGDRVVYPSYGCPNCKRRHRDVRPGRYGVLRRTCACEHKMPTLILLGSHRLDAFCPSCAKPLVEGAGTAPEVRIPFFGATAAGKTRLMHATIKALTEMATEQGATVAAADDETTREHDSLLPVLLSGADTKPTPMTLHRALSFHVTPASGGKRLVRLFDAAGERSKDSDRLRELAYLAIARSFVFVIDPLSVDEFWGSLTRDEQERLGPSRSRFEQPEFVFQQILENIQGMGGDTSRGRLAVTLSKADLIARVSIINGAKLTHSTMASLLDERLGLGHLIRSMQQNFAEVGFFFTAAVVNGHGTVDPSVRTITDWLLRGEGLQLDRAEITEIV